MGRLAPPSRRTTTGSGWLRWGPLGNWCQITGSCWIRFPNADANILPVAFLALGVANTWQRCPMLPALALATTIGWFLYLHAGNTCASTAQNFPHVVRLAAQGSKFAAEAEGCENTTHQHIEKSTLSAEPVADTQRLLRN